MVISFEDFYEKDIINGITNETYICLILKENPIRIKDICPLSLVLNHSQS